MTEEDTMQHPCFNRRSVGKYGRIHLAVAPKCNIQCGYCDRKYGCVNENRPGVTCNILKPEESIEYARKILEADSRIRVIGIAGPGEAFANKETLETLRLVSEHFPDHLKCLSTNGLGLPDNMDGLREVGLDNLTVTVNTKNPLTGAKIYRYVNYKGKKYTGEQAAQILWENQRDGILQAIDAGIRVKVNTVYIPGINDDEVIDLSAEIRDLGVRLMNLMPLIPLADFAGYTKPTREELNAKRAVMQKNVPQMDWCRQCRADAVGMLTDESEGCDLGCGKYARLRDGLKPNIEVPGFLGC